MSRPEAGHLTVKGVFTSTVAQSYLTYSYKKFQGLTASRRLLNTSHRLSAVKACAAMADAPTLPLQNGRALVGGSQAVCPADAGDAAGGTQPHNIPVENDQVMAASSPQRKGTSSTRIAAMGRTRSREERERRRRVSLAIADHSVDLLQLVPAQRPLVQPRRLQLEQSSEACGKTRSSLRSTCTRR